MIIAHCITTRFCGCGFLRPFNDSPLLRFPILCIKIMPRTTKLHGRRIGYILLCVIGLMLKYQSWALAPSGSGFISNVWIKSYSICFRIKIRCHARPTLHHYMNDVFLVIVDRLNYSTAILF